MFDELKLGTKIAAGYALVLLTTSLVTAFTLYEVTTQTDAANELANETAPQVRIANEIERSSLATMKEMKTFEMSLDPQYLAAAMKNLEKVDLGLAQAEEHAKKHSKLLIFGAAISKVSGLVRDYRGLVEKTQGNVDEILTARLAMNTSAARFMDSAQAFERARPDSLAIQKVMVLGTETRLNAWKAQAQNDGKALDKALASLAATDAELDQLRGATHQVELLKFVDTALGAAREYGTQIKVVQSAMRESSDLGVLRGATGTQVNEATKGLANAGVADTMSGTTGMAAALSRVKLVVLTGLCVAICLGVLLTLLVTRAITLPVNRIISGLSGAGEQVASASSQVSSSSQQLANGASQQASNLEEVSSSLEEVTSMTRQNADNARKANGTAKLAAEAANRGASSMARMSEAMQKIRSSATETAKIVKTIDEIAFQTNLLALNAAVEAARAGEAGKGFAVVAEEVRNLAQRSAEAAKTTAALIEEAQRNVEGGAAISEQVNGILREIVSSAGEVTSLVADVATASEQQTSGVTQINTAVSQMDRITQSNAANAEESASASEELSAQAIELNEMVEQLGRLVNGAGASVARPQVARKPAQKSAQQARANTPRAAMPRAAAPSAPRRGASPPPPPLGFEHLPSVDPKELIPLDDSELKSF